MVPSRVVRSFKDDKVASAIVNYVTSCFGEVDRLDQSGEKGLHLININGEQVCGCRNLQIASQWKEYLRFLPSFGEQEP